MATRLFQSLSPFILTLPIANTAEFSNNDISDPTDLWSGKVQYREASLSVWLLLHQIPYHFLSLYSPPTIPSASEPYREYLALPYLLPPPFLRATSKYFRTGNRVPRLLLLLLILPLMAATVWVPRLVITARAWDPVGNTGPVSSFTKVK